MRPSEPRSIEAIKGQLDAFRKGNELFLSFPLDDFASQLASESILAHEDALTDELRAAEVLGSTDDIELSLTGMPVHEHSVAADFLGILLSGLQDLVKLVSFGIKHISLIGEEIPEKVLKESKMMVTGWSASSFTVKIKLPELEGIGAVFSADRREKVLRCLEELFWDDASDRELTGLVTKYAIKSTYKKLLRNVATHKATIQLRTKHKPYGIRLTSERAKERITWMDEPEEETNSLILIGQLIGGNLESRQFYLKVGEITYSGKALKEAHEQMRSFKLGDTVKALLKETTRYRRRAQVEPTVTYKLESIIRMDVETGN